ncbi:hypothetical protein, partial [Rhodococcus sp. IEGM 1307]|uniref:hypothetical protein n=1 Tax=Rhodococcus sp. IEGM 1307 TaxID=3047091 RepID=UPI0024B6FD1F
MDAVAVADFPPAGFEVVEEIAAPLIGAHVHALPDHVDRAADSVPPVDDRVDELPCGGEVALAGADDEVLRDCADGVGAAGFDAEADPGA